MIPILCEPQPIGQCYNINNKNKYFEIYESDLINE